MDMLVTILNQGLIFSLVAMAVYVTSRVLNKDDLSVEGSFGLGGAVTAVCLQNHLPAWPTVAVVLLLGGLTGVLTGTLFTRLKMNHLMAGLVTTTACFSLSLALASANAVVLRDRTVFHGHEETLMLLVVVAGAWLLVTILLRSEIGLALRVCGDNPDLLVHFGKSKSVYQTLGFATSNALTAVAGSLFVQWSGFFSVTGSVGTLVTGLASLMLAELLSKKLIYVVIAATVYQSVFAITLSIGVPPVWNNLTKAVIIILLVSISRFPRKVR